MISRFLVPQDARISPTETVPCGVVRHDLLVRKRLIPAGARITEVAEAGAASGNPVDPVSRNPMVPKRLVPLNASIGEASEHGGATSPLARQAIFSEALLERVSLGRRNKCAEWLLSFAIHAALVGVVLIIPLFYAQVIDLNKFNLAYLAAPPALGAPLPPPPAAVVPPQIARKTTLRPGKLTMPIAMPKAVQMHSAPEVPPEIAGVPGGVTGGTPGGEIGGVLSGLLASSEPIVPSAPPVATSKAFPSGPLRVGGNVKPPRAVYQPEPEYPPLARRSRIQGEVEIDATIDRNGNVVEVRAMSGPPLLLAAALQAVKAWKYEPTYLNGVPYPVELTVNVTFTLSS